MLGGFWPFRTGADEVFHQSQPEAKEDIFSSIGDMPRHDYVTELRLYNEARWRKGMIHNVFPSLVYGSIFGLGWGLYQSRRVHLRHISRPRVIITHVGSITMIALTTSAVHHFLVVSAGYQTSSYQPLVSGLVGGMAYSMTMAGNVNVVAGMVVGFTYTIINKVSDWYHERALVNFLTTQQQIQTPIYRVAPELQHMYRAFLYDHRPIEDSDELRRKALLLQREASDTRLDSQSYLLAFKNMSDAIEFPPWWPLRFAQPVDERQALLEQRLKDDEVKRRLDGILGSDGGATVFSNPLRSSKARKEFTP